MQNVRERALQICRTHGSGSDEYAAFVAEVMKKGLPAGVTLPRQVPGDLRDSTRTLSARSRKKKGAKQRRSATGIEKPVRTTLQKSLTSTPPCEEKSFVGRHVRSVSETLLIEGLEPVVITTRLSADVAAGSEESGWTSTGTPSRKYQRRSMQRTTSVSSTATSAETEIELKKLRSLADRYNDVVSEKARVECNLSQERKNNESLRRKYRTLERQHSDLTTEQDTMNEQVALQLQHLLKEKAQLVQENNKLKAENDNLHVLLEYATVAPESDEDTELVAEKMASQQQDGHISLHGISAWHPAVGGHQRSGSEGASHFGDENDVQSPTSDGVQVELLSNRLDRIAIESCKG